jgi:esterase/lipase
VPLLPGAEPFAADGGSIGVLLSHGFTGSPQSLRPWAEHLAAAGYAVRLPRLPGHGTTWQEMNTTRWTDWHVVEPLSGLLLQAGATSTTVREVILEDSYHVATLDNDAQLIFDLSTEFIQEQATQVRQ